MTNHRLRCTVTRYDIIDGALREKTSKETTGYRIERGWLYLNNSAASAWLSDVLREARAGQGWSAQSGTPPVFLEGRWGGRVWPKIYVEADALLELQEVMT